MRKYLVTLAALLMAGAVWAGPVNINKADAKTLVKELDGVGPAKAEAIIQYRTENGPFATPDGIKKVSGIGDAIYDANKAHIKVKD
jgi:competence protein ComEA